MNLKSVVYLLCAVLVFSLASCGASLTSDKAKVSYGLGTMFANQMKNGGMEVDMKAYIQAYEDVMSGKKSRLTDDEIRTAFQKIQEEVMKKQIAISEENQKKADEFLKKNEKKAGVKKTASGLQYRVIKEGTGIMPNANSKVKVHYKGTLTDGTEFDSSYKRNEPVEFDLKQPMIPGWIEGVQLMKVGSKYELVIPPSLGYGDRGQQKIPGNSVLIFEVELLDVK